VSCNAISILAVSRLSVKQDGPCHKMSSEKKLRPQQRAADGGGRAVDSHGPSDRTRKITVLAIGDMANWRATGRDLPWDSQITFADFSQIDRRMIDSVRPDVVISPLLCKTFDCLDLATVLCQAGFRGRFRIMTQRLPDPTVVLSEARAICPLMDIDVVIDQLILSDNMN
jgi:hypothetical protein